MDDRYRPAALEAPPQSPHCDGHRHQRIDGPEKRRNRRQRSNLSPSTAARQGRPVRVVAMPV